MIKLFPSLIAADQLRLESALTSVAYASDGLHLDVMDFSFVPNQTLSPAIINAIAQQTNKQLWVHLMTIYLEQWLNALSMPTHSIISFHLEATAAPEKIMALIKKKQCNVSIALNPDTPLTTIVPFIHTIDQLLIMSVNPGFAGQQFIEGTYQRLQEVQRLKQQYNALFTVGIDGGINDNNIERVIQLGCTDVVLGSFVFNNKSPEQILKDLHKKINNL